MPLALVAIPVLIRGLGTARFGVLTLAWMVIGYFSLFDLGLGRALTKLVAEKLGAGRTEEVPPLAWTALLLMFVLGGVGALLVGLLSPWLVRDVLRIPRALQAETVAAFYCLGLSIPLVTSTAGLRGILEAQHRFDLANVVRVLLGVITFLGPVAVLPVSASLVAVVAALVAGRLLVWLAALVLCLWSMPALRRFSLDRAAVGPLLRFGGWMTVTNVVGPLMVYLDRFLIGAMLSVTAVAYYVTPYEVVTKLWIFPSALVAVLFPAFSASFAQDGERAVLLFSRGVKYVFLALFPICLLIVALAPEGLNLWLGTGFAQNSAAVLQWLAIGVFLNSLAQIPFALVQGAGRPDLTARLHLLELPFYLLGVWWLIRVWGIDGAAVAWVARVAVDTVVLFAMAQRILPGRALALRRVAAATGAALLVLALGAVPAGLAAKAVFILLTLVGFGLSAWFLILAPEERALLQGRFRTAQALD